MTNAHDALQKVLRKAVSEMRQHWPRPNEPDFFFKRHNDVIEEALAALTLASGTTEEMK